MYRLLMILTVALLALGACSTNKATTPPAGNTVQATAQLTFTPVTLSIKKGDTVTWNNSSGIAHNVTFQSGPSFSQALNDGSTVSRTFTTTGTFNYFCSIHGQSMHGTIVVS